MDIGSVAAAVNHLKSAGDIVAGLINLKSTSEVQSKAIELNQKLIAAQHEIFAANAEHSKLIVRANELEQEIAKLNEWNERKKRYKLVNPWEGNPALVYSVRESCRDTEAAHWICTKCFDDNRRSILQPKKGSNGFILLACATCKAEVETGWRGIGPAEYVAD